MAPKVETSAEGLPAEGELQTPAAPAIDVEGLVAELERAGVTNTQELQNKFKASSESGRLAQLLGEERKRSESLTAQMQELSQRQASQPREDIFGEPQGQPIDIEEVVGKAYRKERAREMAQMQQMQQATFEAWNRINMDEDMALVQPIWEQKLKDPTFTFKLQSGQIDPLTEYNKTVRQYYKEMMKKSVDTIKQLRGGQPPGAPPFMESGERTSANLVSEGKRSSEAQEKLRRAQEQVNKKGLLSEEEELDVIDALLKG